MEPGSGSDVLRVPPPPGAANNCVPVSLPQPAAAAAAATGGAHSSSSSSGSRDAAVAAAVAAAAVAVVPLPASSFAVVTPAAAEEEEEEMVEGHDSGTAGLSHDDLDQMVHEAFEQEIENINQAVHAAFEQEKADFELELTDAMSQTVADAVETAIFDRAFDFRANINTLFALTGVILFWRGVWNLFDTWLGTESLQGNVGSLLIGLSIILLFRIFKLPLAEFW